MTPKGNNTDLARKQQLSEFVSWVSAHIKGYEKGEAQIYLDHLFRAFGHKGVAEAGALLEMQLKKSGDKGTTFADLVWMPRVLIEMKKRGERLERHYTQARDYWFNIEGGKPAYVVLCNFDEFWVYDFFKQPHTPVDRVKLAELPDRYGPLSFLFPAEEAPVFGVEHVAVTKQAADKLSECFRKLTDRKVERPLAQRFILQILVALFSEDIGLLPKYMLTKLLDDCVKPADSYDLLGGLFEAMNSPQNRGGRFKDVQYFNGGIFAAPAKLDLHPDEVAQLREAAGFDWSKVKPEIFGTIFEHSLGKEQRHAFGAHFTTEDDILKIVVPTIVRPWTEQIEDAKTLKRLEELHGRMRTFRVLDPACGSGNFLYIAYREMKRLEARIFERINELSAKAVAAQGRFGFLSAHNFYGFDIEPLGVELAKVTMVLARKLAIDELHINEPALPLDNLDKNFFTADALLGPIGNPTAWPKADVIIGNPPFLGAKLLKPERGADYVNSLRAAYPQVPGMADYCVYLFRKAHDMLPPCTAGDPLAGRAGLVGTQNVRNNQSRVGGLDHIVETGTIVEAVDNQPWSGEANVHVSIVNWVKTQDRKLLPPSRRLWRKLAATGSEPRRQIRKGNRADKDYQLVYSDCPSINSALSDSVDLSSAKTLLFNVGKGNVCQGVTPGHSGFVLTEDQKTKIIRSDHQSEKVIYPYLIGRELLSETGLPSRYIIDFEQRTILEAKEHPGAFAHIQTHVLPDIRSKADAEHQDESARSVHLQKWWQHWRSRSDLISEIARVNRFIVCSRVTKRPIFVFVDSGIRPGDALQAFCFDDDYSFGILQSDAHWKWFQAKCSKLKSDYRYTPESVFDTFPWPQAPARKEILSVAKAGREIRAIREKALQNLTGGLRALYRTLELPGKNPLKDAHLALDEAVLDAYGFSRRKDLLGQLLELNLGLADLHARGKAVTPPGVPADFAKPKELVTDDCIRMQ